MALDKSNGFTTDTFQHTIGCILHTGFDDVLDILPRPAVLARSLACMRAKPMSRPLNLSMRGSALAQPPPP